jgi:signal transduction histidine kinase
MSESTSKIISLTIIISTCLLLVFGIIITRYIFLYQRKRYKHNQEIIELRESFTQTLLQSKIEIQEQTLDHISKEIHANFSHIVSLININLSGILPNCSPFIKDNILETKLLAKQLLSELKALSVSLNTDHIMKIGFVKSLENELNRLSKAKNYKITFSKTGEEKKLLPEQEIILFRLCQEVLNNILKHSKAKSISASLNYSSSFFKLEIIDDGLGFDLKNVLQKTGETESTGLINIQKRAKLINADISINSTLGVGTKIIIEIPLNP